MDESVFELYGGDLTSDALLVLKEEPPADQHPSASPGPTAEQPLDAAAAHPKLSCVTLPTHRAVLWPLSDYFQSKFKNWSSTDSKPQITILLPHGQMHIGRALVTAMYAQLPNDLNQQELLQLLTLAESYKIDKVSSAVLERFSSMPSDQLQWETVLAVLQLPKDNPMYASVKRSAKKRYTQLLGDLEVVWALEHPAQRKLLQARLAGTHRTIALRAEEALTAFHGETLQHMSRADVTTLTRRAQTAQHAARAAAQSTTPPHELVLQLPFRHLTSLVGSDNVKAASENAVYYTATRWLQHNEATQEQQQQLAAVLRLSQCSPNYLVNEVLKEGSWLLQYCSTAEAVSAVTQAVSKSHSLERLLQPQYGPWPNARQASALCALDISWDIPFAEIQAAYEQVVREGQEDWTHMEQPNKFIWQGIGFQLTFSMFVITDAARWAEDEELGCVKSMYLEIHPTPAFSAEYESSITIWKEAGPGHSGEQTEYLQQDVPAGTPQEKIRDDSQKVYVLINSDWVDVQPPQQHIVVERIGSNWPEVEQKLRRLQLVHSDGCLHVTARVTRVY